MPSCLTEIRDWEDGEDNGDEERGEYESDEEADTLVTEWNV